MWAKKIGSLVPKESCHAHLIETRSLSLKGVWLICLEGHALYHWGSKKLHNRASPWGILHFGISTGSGCTNRQTLIFHFSYFTTKTDIIFELLTFTARIFWTNCVTDLLYTLLESPSMQLHRKLIKKGVASCRGPSRPFKWNSILSIQVGLAALLWGPCPFSLNFQGAGYQSFPMRYITLL